MNKILIGALAGLADLTLLTNSVKTKAEAEWFWNSGGMGGMSHMNTAPSFFSGLPFAPSVN